MFRATSKFRVVRITIRIKVSVRVTEGISAFYALHHFTLSSVILQLHAVVGRLNAIERTSLTHYQMTRQLDIH